MMTETKTTQLKATFVGFTAVLMWSALALLTKLSGPLPPFQRISMAFTIAFVIGLILWWRKGSSVMQVLKLPWSVWLVGIGGLFGYHFFYFIALDNAPPVEAGLIAYLWPLLIVLLSALLPTETLRWFHMLGALCGFIGAGLLVQGDATLTFNWAYGWGYLAAFVCAFVWAGYSVLSRFFGAIPTDAVGGFCGATAVLALICHFLFEETIWPAVTSEWLAVFLLGLGPIGAAFFTWDYGLKRGNIKVLGALSYLAPLLSTLLLILFGFGQPTWVIAWACVLIIGGALLAAGDFLRKN